MAIAEIKSNGDDKIEKESDGECGRHGQVAAAAGGQVEAQTAAGTEEIDDGGERSEKEDASPDQPCFSALDQEDRRRHGKKGRQLLEQTLPGWHGQEVKVASPFAPSSAVSSSCGSSSRKNRLLNYPCEYFSRHTRPE